MTRPHKLLAKFRNNPKSVHFHQLETVLAQLGFVRIKTNAGSHLKWLHPTKRIVYRAPRQNLLKAAYIKEFLKTIDEHFPLLP